MNKIKDGRVFSLVRLTWNDPNVIHIDPVYKYSYFIEQIFLNLS